MATRAPSSKGIRNIIIAVFGILALLFGLIGLDPFRLFDPAERIPTPAPAQPASADGAPETWQVFFSDPGLFSDPQHYAGSLEERLIGLIQNAQSSIHIASFEFNLTPVAEALVAAHARGVDVRWITDDENGLEADEEPGGGQFALLSAAGIPLRADGRSALMHNKFWIFDRRIVWTGSTNITQNGIFRNNNNVVIVHSPTLADIYEHEFAEMWAGEFGPGSPSRVQDQLVEVDGTTVQVLFAPEDRVLDFLVPLVRSADEQIRFMAFSFTNDRLAAAMLERAGQGVGLQGIFETRGSETEFGELSRLACAGYEMRQDGNPGAMHHKVIVIDGRIVVTGSLNFSDNANESNNENVMIIENPQIADRFLQEFSRRWREAAAPDSRVLNCSSLP